jgi:hypothetical protein
MKKMFRFYAVVAIAVAGLVGCSSEVIEKGGTGPIGGVDEVEAGIPTYATFEFEVQQAADTRSGVTMEPQTSESSDVNDLRLFVFDVKNGNLEANEIVTGAGAITVGSSKLSKTVKVTSGNKRVFVIANTATITPLNTFFNALDSTVLYSQFIAQLWDLDAANGSLLGTVGAGSLADPKLKAPTLPGATGPGLAPTAAAVPTSLAGLPSLVASAGFVMSNAVDSASLKTLKPFVSEDDSRKGGGTAVSPAVDPEFNHFAIRIQRTVAKVAFAYTSAAALATTDGKGSILAGSIWYTLENINRSLYLFQRFPSDMAITTPLPSAALALTPNSAYSDYMIPTPVGTPPIYKNFWYRGYGGTVEYHSSGTPLPAPSTGAGYQQISVGPTFGTPVYLTENTSLSGGQLGSVTYASVSAIFVPGVGQLVVNGAPGAPVITAVTYNNTLGAYQGATLNSGGYPTTLNPAIPTSNALYQLRNVPTTYPAGNFVTENVFFYDKELAYKVAYALNNIPYNPTAPETGFSAGTPTNAPTAISGITTSLTYNKETNAHTNVTLVAEYVNGGRAYYRLDVGEQATNGVDITPAVKRNHSYSIMINGFKSIGDPNPGDTNFPPDQPYQAPTHITASITVDAWRNVSAGTILGPQ